jgi:histone arginine demethylase JMJD6
MKKAPTTAIQRYVQVDRRSGLSLSDFKRDYLRPLKPVVITDAIDHWEARKLWTFDYFRNQIGSTPIMAYRYDKKDEFTPGNVREMTLGEYVDGVTTKSLDEFPYYLRDNWRIFHVFPELMRQHDEPAYFFDWFKLFPEFMRMPYPRIFIGPKGAITPLHLDVWRTHAWLSQLVGRKRWLLFPPDQAGYLYNYKVRCEAPDYQAHPLYRQAAPLETVIGPGDTVWVPSGWSHWVESLDASISISYNYMGPGCFTSCLTNTFKTALSVERFRRALSNRFRAGKTQTAGT